MTVVDGVKLFTFKKKNLIKSIFFNKNFHSFMVDITPIPSVGITYK